jgi:hypothetical protein
MKGKTEKRTNVINVKETSKVETRVGTLDDVLQRGTALRNMEPRRIKANFWCGSLGGAALAFPPSWRHVSPIADSHELWRARVGGKFFHIVAHIGRYAPTLQPFPRVLA